MSIAKRSGKCKGCGRPLSDPQSITRGYGPECASKMARMQAQAEAREAALATTVKLIESKPNVVLVGLGMYSEHEYIIVEKLPDGAIRKIPATYEDGHQAAKEAVAYARHRYLGGELTPRLCIPAGFRA